MSNKKGEASFGIEPRPDFRSSPHSICKNISYFSQSSFHKFLLVDWHKHFVLFPSTVFSKPFWFRTHGILRWVFGCEAGGRVVRLGRFFCCCSHAVPFGKQRSCIIFAYYSKTAIRKYRITTCKNKSVKRLERKTMKTNSYAIFKIFWRFREQLAILVIWIFPLKMCFWAIFGRENWNHMIFGIHVLRRHNYLRGLPAAIGFTVASLPGLARFARAKLLLYFQSCFFLLQ